MSSRTIAELIRLAAGALAAEGGDFTTEELERLYRHAESTEGKARWWRCLVCGGPPRGDYQVRAEVWAACGWAPREGVACLACLNAKLRKETGRELTLGDLEPCGSNGAILWALGHLCEPSDLEVRAARFIGAAASVLRVSCIMGDEVDPGKLGALEETRTRLLREAARWPAAVDWDEEVRDA